LKYLEKLKIAIANAITYENILHFLLFRPTNSEANEKYKTGINIADTSRRYCQIRAEVDSPAHVTPNKPKLHNPIDKEKTNQ
jgi:hypothetical protein